MKKIVIAVDETKKSRNIFNTSLSVCSCMAPKEIVLVYVEQFAGKSLLSEMISDTDLSTLKEVLEGTEYQEALDAKANTVLDFYQSTLKSSCPSISIKKIIRSGHPGEEILAVSKEESANMIIVGSHGKRDSSILMGSVSREVANKADIPVLIMR